MRQLVGTSGGRLSEWPWARSCFSDTSLPGDWLFAFWWLILSLVVIDMRRRLVWRALEEVVRLRRANWRLEYPDRIDRRQGLLGGGL